MLDVTTTLSIFVNAGIVAFTGTFALNDTWAERIWLFILLSGGAVNVSCSFVIRSMELMRITAACRLKLFLQYYVPDVPADIEIQLARHELIKDKVIEHKQVWGASSGCIV